MNVAQDCVVCTAALLLFHSHYNLLFASDLADQRVGELLPDHSHQVSVAAVSGDVRPTLTAFVEIGSVTAASMCCLVYFILPAQHYKFS